MLRSKQENSQNSPLNNPKTAPAPQSPQEIEGFEDDELDEDDETEEIEEETPQPIAKPVSKPVSKPTAEEIQQMQIAQVMQEIELLQNDGRFRVEFLHQLQELNNALSVIAGLIGTIVEAKDGQDKRN